jgi:hypothetical protein
MLGRRKTSRKHARNNEHRGAWASTPRRAADAGASWSGRWPTAGPHWAKDCIHAPAHESGQEPTPTLTLTLALILVRSLVVRPPPVGLRPGGVPGQSPRGGKGARPREWPRTRTETRNTLRTRTRGSGRSARNRRDAGRASRRHSESALRRQGRPREEVEWVRDRVR